MSGEEGNLYKIVLASTRQLARIRSYLRRFVEKTDPLDMDAYAVNGMQPGVPSSKNGYYPSSRQ